MNQIRRVFAVFLAAAAVCSGILTGTGYAKTENTEEYSIQLFVFERGQKLHSCAIGDPHKWIIQADVPKDVSSSAKYTITQTLPHALSYQQNSFWVSCLTQENQELPLKMGEHYDLVTGTVLTDGHPSERISMSLTEKGITYIQKFMHRGTQNPKVQIQFKAVINENASMGTQIVHTVQLGYTDSEGNYSQARSDKASVSVGGIHICLTDESGRPIRDGNFMLARPADSNELENRRELLELLDIGEETIAVVYESFYDSEDMQRKTDVAATGQDGCAVMYGLAYGDYYLVQTAAPHGKIPEGRPAKIIINEVSHLTTEDGWYDSSGKAADNTIRIINSDIYMPQTGGIGTTAFTAAGTVIILSAGILMMSNRKSKIKH